MVLEIKRIYKVSSLKQNIAYKTKDNLAVISFILFINNTQDQTYKQGVLKKCIKKNTGLQLGHPSHRREKEGCVWGRGDRGSQ